MIDTSAGLDGLCWLGWLLMITEEHPDAAVQTD